MKERSSWSLIKRVVCVYEGRYDKQIVSEMKVSYQNFGTFTSCEDFKIEIDAEDRNR